jgi:hypothetical protein
MISFKTYILSENEILLEKDTYFSPHLSHLEDLAIEGGKNGFNSFLIQATNIINKLKGFESEQEINAKIDGAPSILFGADPRPEANKQFFVALKYVIDESTDTLKENAKLLHSEQEIDQNFSGKQELATKLKSLLSNLRSAYDNSGKIYQADVLFTSPADKSRVKIGNEEYIAFKPNTIMYTVPIDDKSPLFASINSSNVGVIVHDSFTGVVSDNGKSIKLKPAGKNISSLISSSQGTKAFIRGSNYGEVAFDMSDKMVHDIEKTIAAATKHVNGIDNKFDQEYVSSAKGSIGGQILPLLKIYLNKQVDLEDNGIFGAAKTGTKFDTAQFYEGFKAFVNERISKGIEELGEKGRAAREQKISSIMKFLDMHRKSFESLIHATYEMVRVKFFILQILSQLDTRLTSHAFYQLPDGSYAKAKDEGYVLFVGNNQVKIVDRVDFTKMNRLMGGRF